MEPVELGAPGVAVVLHRLRRPFVWPPSPFGKRPFATLLVNGAADLAMEDCSTVAARLVADGCRHVVCVGHDASVWEDAVDEAYLDSVNWIPDDLTLVASAGLEEGSEAQIDHDGVCALLHGADLKDFAPRDYLLLLLEAGAERERRLLEFVRHHFPST